jgi:hypothetical protein
LLTNEIELFLVGTFSRVSVSSRRLAAGDCHSQRQRSCRRGYATWGNTQRPRRLRALHGHSDPRTNERSQPPHQAKPNSCPPKTSEQWETYIASARHRRRGSANYRPEFTLMTPQFEIYKVFGRQNRAWIESAKTLRAAFVRIEQLSKYLPGQYVVKNTATNEEHPCKAGGKS